MNEQTEVINQRYLNRSAVKAHALKCSVELRAGKFERVSDDFFVGIQAQLEGLVHTINGKFVSSHHKDLPVDGLVPYVSGEFMKRVRDALDRAVARAIQRAVESHPSVGKTLK